MVSRDSERVEVLDDCCSGSLFNLSATGAAFLHNAPLEQGSRVILSVNDAEFESRVVYCHQRTDGYRIGIQFTTVTMETRIALGRMIDSFSCGGPLQFHIITIV